MTHTENLALRASAKDLLNLYVELHQAASGKVPHVQLVDAWYFGTLEYRAPLALLTTVDGYQSVTTFATLDELSLWVQREVARVTYRATQDLLGDWSNGESEEASK